MLSQDDVARSSREAMDAPIWHVRYDHDGKKMAFVVDGNSGAFINKIGL